MRLTLSLPTRLSLAVCFCAAPVAAQCSLYSFEASDGAANDSFGALALDGDRLLVGAGGHDHLALGAGAAYVFERGSDGRWQETSELLASDGGPDDAFGCSVALSADLAIVGAYTDSPVALYSGSAYIFERDAAGNWSESAKLVPGDGGASHLFGSSVAIAGPDEVLVGAPQAGTTSFAPGAVYVYRRTTSGWAQAARLQPLVPGNGGWFGAGLDVSGARMAIHASPIGAPEYGRTYVFDRAGASWSQSAQIYYPGGAFGDLDGTRMLVASPYDSSQWQWSGVVRVLDLVGGSWVESALFQPEVPDSLLLFGTRIALEGGRALVGTRFGEVSQYQQSGAGWSSIASFQAGSLLLSVRDFALSGERLLVAESVSGSESISEFLLSPTESVYCDATPNSSGGEARIQASHCNAVSANDFRLEASPLPDQPGLFFYGSRALQLPFGDGFRCVGGPLVRFPLQVAHGGVMTLDVDLGALPNPAYPISAGSTWYFQAWFLDPLQAAGFQLSDAVSVLFL